MIKRPTKKDSDNDIIRMQQEFYAEQNRDVNFQPAAKVVRIQREGDANIPESASTGRPIRQSEFAKRRAQLKEAARVAEPDERVDNQDAGSEEMEADPVEPPIESFVMGEVVERQPVNSFKISGSMVDGSFPKTMHITTYPSQPKSDGTTKSLFAQMMSKEKKCPKNDDEISSDRETIHYEEPAGSALLEGWDAPEIHNENMRKLQQMSVDEICKERDQLLTTLDPKVVEFIKSRKKQLPMAIGTPAENKPAECKKIPDTAMPSAGMEVLREEGSDQWINFNVLEPEKLEWTKDIERSVKELKPGESYEARFDWKGILQPYVLQTNDKNEDDRELYLHGEDAQRPGYTLQELFRLARSNVLQQRISALGAIAGILNLMNQGFYDGSLELPVSKVFFFLRFALDENTPSVVDVASRALASLFYNETDEILLDTIFDSEFGMVQPEMALNITHSRDEERKQRETELQAGFGALNLGGSRQPPKSRRFETNLPDDDPDDVHNRETMNDFHLAETDLVECLLRTNILERIRYILFAMKPEGATVINCAKLLIRMARTNEQMALNIATNEPLIGGLLKGYLTSVDSSGDQQPQHVVLKLVRVLCGYRHTFYDQHLHRFHVVSLVKRYIFSRKDINVKMIQIQIEAFRFFRLLLQSKQDDELYSELWPALCYLLEWHYQHLIFAEDGPFIIRQHCVALLALIGPGLQPGAALPAEAGASFSSSTTTSVSNRHRQLGDKLFACCSKWFTAAQRGGANEFSQKLLLAACLWTAGRARSSDEAAYQDFLRRYLLPFVRSDRFGDVIQSLSSSSLILTQFEDRTQYGIASLPTLGAVQLRRNQTIPTLVVTTSYPVFLLHALLALLIQQQSAGETTATSAPIAELNRLLLENASHRQYFGELLANGCNHGRQPNPPTAGSGGVGSLVCNWFAQTVEQRYLLDVLNLMVLWRKSAKQLAERPSTTDPPSAVPSAGQEDTVAKSVALRLAFTVTFSTSEAFYPALVKLFDDIIFLPGYYDPPAGSEVPVSGADLQRWKLNYKLLAQRTLKNEHNVTSAPGGFTVTEWRAPLLPRSWPYSPLYLMVEKLEKGAPRLEVLSEQAIIGTGLRFSELVEANGITVACPTERLMYLLAAFMGPDSKFLEPDLSALIERRLAALRSAAREQGVGTANTARPFDFEVAKLEGKKSFYGLYQLALDVFQSSSYGHAGFGSLLMAPLAQKYDVRWRNMVWSEYVAVLRFITCGEQELFDNVEGYLQPEEGDVVLLRSYGQALNSNLLRPGSIPHRVANHHLQAVVRSRAKVMLPQEEK